MGEPSQYLKASWKRRTDESRRKVLEAIETLKKQNEPVNFSTVQKKSGVSKHYLYEHDEIRTMIEAARSEEAERASAWHKKYDRTSKSKDVLISAKDKRIAKLEEENQKLKRELETLRRLLYEQKQSVRGRCPRSKNTVFPGLSAPGTRVMNRRSQECQGKEYRTLTTVM